MTTIEIALQRAVDATEKYYFDTETPTRTRDEAFREIAAYAMAKGTSYDAALAIVHAEVLLLHPHDKGLARMGNPS